MSIIFATWHGNRLRWREHEYSEFLCGRHDRVPSRNENRSAARCTISQFRFHTRDIPPPYDCVPRYRVSFASEKFNEVSLTNRRMNMDRACINSSFFNPISRECLSLSAYHDVYPSTISGWRESVRESVRVAFPLVQYQRFRIHCPYLPIDSKRISLLPFLSSKWASSSMAVMIRL